MRKAYRVSFEAMNDRSFLDRIVTQLRAAGLDVVVFGGWAEEFRGMIPPTAHTDVDLLLFAPNFDVVDRFISNQIPQKRFPHKRAFESEGVLVELFLVRPDGTTPFEPPFAWLVPIRGPDVDGLPVATTDALRAFRAARLTL